MKGLILKRLRKEKGLSQQELATKVNTTQSTIARIESDVREPSNDLMISFANYFDVSLDYLNGLTTDKNEQKDESLVKELLIHLYKANLIKDINNIDDTTKDIIMSMVKKELELISKNTK